MRLQTFTFHCFSEKKLFLRGGISNRYCHIKDSFAVGEGLIQAYLAESKIAVHPRIILHPEIQKNEKLMEKIDRIAKEMYAGRSILQKDANDGIYFIDHLGYSISVADINIPMIGIAAANNPLMYLHNRQMVGRYIFRHAESVAHKIKELEGKLELHASDAKEREKIQSVLDKFLWLKAYHNKSIEGYDYLAEYYLK